MKVYQNLEALGKSEERRGKFVKEAVREFMASDEYAQAKAGEAYYRKHNLTIESYQKLLYTLSGQVKADVFSANYRLKTLFFRRLVMQQVNYILGNGLTLTDPKNKAKLGKNFDHRLIDVAKRAMAGGKAYGFWNNNQMEVFGYVDTNTDPGFCPLYDEKTGEIRAGIRFWFKRIDGDVFERYTLYEEDGYTEYAGTKDKDPVIKEPKRGYKRIVTTANGIEVDVTEENYGKLPIVPLYANDAHESELVGIRESIDAYDFIKSGLANDIDDTSGFYWVLKNAGGMENEDLARFIQRIKSVKAVALDDGVEADAHTLDVPHEARSKMLEILRNDIYEDFQALDVKTLSASAKTTQEIQSAYQSQDNKCADFEYYLLDFVDRILELAGINDEPTFRWNRIINQTEQTSMVLMCANYLTDEMVIKHLPFLTPEEADIVIKDRDADDARHFNPDLDEEEDGDE